MLLKQLNKDIMTDPERKDRIYGVTITGVVVNIILLIGKFIAGFAGHSAAMIADAVHSLSDFLTDVIVLVFVRLSNRPADSRHDYGYGKYETMATSIIGITLVAVGVMIGWDGAEKILQWIKGERLESPGMIALVAAIVSIVMKEWVFRITRKAAVEVDSKVLLANAWHHRSDALSSIGTALGIGGAIVLGSRWAVLDAVAAVVVSVMIIVTAYKLIRDASGELLEESLPQQTEDRIVEVVSRDQMVSDIHNLRTRRIGNRIAIEMHMRLPGEISLEESHIHATAIEKALRDEFGQSTHIILHIEPVKHL